MTCAKRTVVCAIHTRDGRVAIAENFCKRPQLTCPRADGEGYGKCIAICEQQGHAEIQALRAARENNLDVTGAHVYVLGHYYACAECCRALWAAGVGAITILQDGENAVIRSLTGQATH